jgi:hypothetical protein
MRRHNLCVAAGTAARVRPNLRMRAESPFEPSVHARALMRTSGQAGAQVGPRPRPRPKILTDLGVQ